VKRNSLHKNSEAGTNLVHLAKIQALKVLQRQVWRQNEPAIMQTLLLSHVRTQEAYGFIGARVGI
jgi:hypothetical protein